MVFDRGPELPESCFVRQRAEHDALRIPEIHDDGADGVAMYIEGDFAEIDRLPHRRAKQMAAAALFEANQMLEPACAVDAHGARPVADRSAGGSPPARAHRCPTPPPGCRRR